MLRFSILALALAGFAVSEAAALGRDFSKEELEANGQLVKGQKPVHGYWINWDDTYFYSGDTAALNQFLVAYGKLQHFKLKVVIHSGAKTSRSLGDRTGRDIPFDWSLRIQNGGTPVSINAKGDIAKIRDLAQDTPGSFVNVLGERFPSQVDIWLGDRIKREDLRIPANVEVASGIESEKNIGIVLPDDLQILNLDKSNP